MAPSLTTQEAADLIGVTNAQVCWLIRTGKLRARRNRSGIYRYSILPSDARKYRDSPRKRGPRPKNR